jgi:hypothetical protein
MYLFRIQVTDLIDLFHMNKKTLCKVKKKSMRLGKVWYDIFRYIFRFSLKKARWEVGPRPGYGSNRYIRLRQKDLYCTSDCNNPK